MVQRLHRKLNIAIAGYNAMHAFKQRQPPGSPLDTALKRPAMDKTSERIFVAFLEWRKYI